MESCLRAGPWWGGNRYKTPVEAAPSGHHCTRNSPRKRPGSPRRLRESQWPLPQVGNGPRFTPPVWCWTPCSYEDWREVGPARPQEMQVEAKCTCPRSPAQKVSPMAEQERESSTEGGEGERRGRTKEKKVSLHQGKEGTRGSQDDLREGSETAGTRHLSRPGCLRLGGWRPLARPARLDEAFLKLPGALTTRLSAAVPLPAPPPFHGSLPVSRTLAGTRRMSNRHS